MMEPLKLYEICINAAVADCVSACKFCKKDFRNLPNNVLFDFYHKMIIDKRLCLLAVEFSDLDVFLRMISVKHKRTKLLKSFQLLIDHGTNVPEELIKSYLRYCYKSNPNDPNVANVGLRIGAFFNESGLFNYTVNILNITEEVLEKRPRDVATLNMLLDCYHRRIYAEAFYCEFKEAAATFKSAQTVIEDLTKLNALPNLAGLYSNFSFLFLVRSEYDESFKWSLEALRLLTEDLPKRIIIKVLSHASKACVIKRKFHQAGLLIRQAVNLASELYTVDGHPQFSDTLLYYGFYLLNFDSVQESVKVHEKALSIRKEVFDKNNIFVALGHEDIAYALYVQEYSSGRFHNARDNAERAIRIMKRILPKDHLLLASVKRVKALILEEIALDERNSIDLQKIYLLEAEKLHKTVLALSHKTFGEKHVQTAKHYGNLGRLYQSMKQYEEAERMHLKAIAIKEELLGKDDYEVGLSSGHLASLYNYHMQRYEDAEVLYMRSINISLKLFGKAYSGLEYDYRGLMHVYTELLDMDTLMHYSNKMDKWKSRRDQIKPIEHREEHLPLNTIIDKFFSMGQPC